MENKLFAFMLKNPLADNPHCNERCGIYNGYVGIHKDIELPTTYWEDTNNGPYLDDFIYVHGGITLDKYPGEYNIPRKKMHPVTEIPEDYAENYRILGFDTSHYDDNPYKWDYENVKNETLSFLQQIKDFIIEYNLYERT